MSRPTPEVPRRSTPTPADVPVTASTEVKAPSHAADAIATQAPPAQPPVRLSLLGEIEAALAAATDARAHAALATLVTLLHEMRIKFGAAEHLLADDLRAKIKSIL